MHTRVGRDDVQHHAAKELTPRYKPSDDAHMHTELQRTGYRHASYVRHVD